MALYEVGDVVHTLKGMFKCSTYSDYLCPNYINNIKGCAVIIKSVHPVTRIATPLSIEKVVYMVRINGENFFVSADFFEESYTLENFQKMSIYRKHNSLHRKKLFSIISRHVNRKEKHKKMIPSIF